MILREIYAARQSVPLRRPFVTARRSVHTAESVLMRITSANGRTGRGEAPAATAVTGGSFGFGDIQSSVEDRLAPLLIGLGITEEEDPVRTGVGS